MVHVIYRRFFSYLEKLHENVSEIQARSRKRKFVFSRTYKDDMKQWKKDLDFYLLVFSVSLFVYLHSLWILTFSLGTKRDSSSRRHLEHSE